MLHFYCLKYLPTVKKRYSHPGQLENLRILYSRIWKMKNMEHLDIKLGDTLLMLIDLLANNLKYNAQ